MAEYLPAVGSRTGRVIVCGSIGRQRYCSTPSLMPPMPASSACDVRGR